MGQVRFNCISLSRVDIHKRGSKIGPLHLRLCLESDTGDAHNSRVSKTRMQLVNGGSSEFSARVYFYMAILGNEERTTRLVTQATDVELTDDHKYVTIRNREFHFIASMPEGLKIYCKLSKVRLSKAGRVSNLF